MSYLSGPTSKTNYGVVLVGNYIDVSNTGVISLQQDLSPNASVTFANITDSALTNGRVTFAGPSGILSDDGDFTYNSNTNILVVPNISANNVSVSGSLSLNGNSVVTSVTPSAGNGISITGLVSSGPNVSFGVNNTGVLSLIAGNGITISNATGNITISSSGSDFINTYGTAVDYTITSTDEYVGITSSNAVVITLPVGVKGRVYTIKDEYGLVLPNITILPAPSSGELIDGKASFSINIPYEGVTVVFRAGQWHII